MPAQDEDEPEGEFPVRVDEVSFPTQQALAKDSRLVIDVRNVGDRTIPNVNVTVHGFQRKVRNPADPSEVDPELADPERPVFVVNQSPIEFLREPEEGQPSLVDREVTPPAGNDRRGTVYVDTYSLGELPPDESALFRWDVSAVESGPFRLTYEVHAGLDGKAQAVSEGGEPLSGSIAGTIRDTPEQAKVAESDGKTIVTEDGRRTEGGSKQRQGQRGSGRQRGVSGED